MEEIYETEVWKKLEKNGLFIDKYNEIMKKSCYYVNPIDVKTTVKDNKLIISYQSRVMNRELNCQFMKESKYEMFIDSNNNLVVNEMSGSLRTNYGYEFDNNNGGVLNTYYSCNVYDEDGIELGYQSYSDSYILYKELFDDYKSGYLFIVENTCNPNLVSSINNTISFPHARVIGDSPRFVRQIRQKNDLGIVISSTCEFGKDGSVLNPKEEYYFNTFLSRQTTMNPERISITRNYPFATIDDNNAMHFNDIYVNSGLTAKNYKEVANERFLKELQEEKEQNSNSLSKDVVDKYDLMIQKLEEVIVNNRTATK